MEVKKTPKANLENKKMLFREIGLIITLLLVLGGFEYKTYEKSISELGGNNAALVEDEMIPITNETPPPPVHLPDRHIQKQSRAYQCHKRRAGDC